MMLQIPLSEIQYANLKAEAKAKGYKNARQYAEAILLRKNKDKSLTDAEISTILISHKNNPQMTYKQLGDIIGVSWFKAWAVCNPERLKQISINAKRRYKHDS